MKLANLMMLASNPFLALLGGIQPGQGLGKTDPANGGLDFARKSRSDQDASGIGGQQDPAALMGDLDSDFLTMARQAMTSNDPGESGLDSGETATPSLAPAAQPGEGGSTKAVATSGSIPETNDSSSVSVDTGTGTEQTYNVHNNTDRDQSFLYSDASGNKAVMHLAAGQVGTFTGGNDQPGIRIQSCGPNGETRSPANEALFEAGTQKTADGAVNNPDVSDVDGNLSYDGQGTDIEVTNNLGQKVGNQTGNAYRNWNDDTKADRSNPMTMAQTKANQFDIAFTDSSQTLANPGVR